MKCNVGAGDRALRIIVGLALMVMAYMGTIGVWGWIGIIPLMTGMIKFCPMYAILGMKTCKTD
jgi:membrane-bound ClpP family serine protease